MSSLCKLHIWYTRSLSILHQCKSFSFSILSINDMLWWILRASRSPLRGWRRLLHIGGAPRSWQTWYLSMRLSNIRTDVCLNHVYIESCSWVWSKPHLWMRGYVMLRNSHLFGNLKSCAWWVVTLRFPFFFQCFYYGNRICLIEGHQQEDLKRKFLMRELLPKTTKLLHKAIRSSSRSRSTRCVTLQNSMT